MPYGPLYCRSLHRKPLSKGGNRSRSFPESKRNLFGCGLVYARPYHRDSCWRSYGWVAGRNVRLLLLYPNGNNPVPGDIGCLIPGIVFADGCMPRKMYIATFVVRDWSRIARLPISNNTVVGLDAVGLHTVDAPRGKRYNLISSHR